MAVWTARVGVGLLMGTAIFHLSAYDSVVGRSPGDTQPLIGAAWIAGGASLVLAGLLVVVATPVFVVRRAAFLLIAALTPLSIAILQILYLGFIPPTGLLLLDAAAVIASALLGMTATPSSARAA
jgi:hypothetical protein